MTKDEVIKMAIDVLEICNGAETVEGYVIYTDEEIEALRAALAQPESEPVAYRSRWRNTEGQTITGWVVHLDTTANPDPRQEIEPLYLAPPQRKPLTDEEIDALILPTSGCGTVQDFVRVIEAAHGIKD